MKTGKLWFKLAASFTAVIVVSTLIMVIVINSTTRAGFTKMVFEGDTNSAEDFSRLAEEYLRRGGTVRELEEYVTNSFGMPMMSHRGSDRSAPQPVHPMMGPMTSRRSLNRPGIILTDQDGLVTAHNIAGPVGEKLRRLSPRDGIPIIVDDQVIRHVFIGTMIEPVLGPFQQSFLSSVNRAALISSLLAAAAAVALGSFLFFHITAPVRELSNASKQIAGGDFTAAVPVKRNDELGDLSRSFNTMAAELLKTEAWKKQLIADSAHELRTPVGLIQGRLEMILEGIYPPSLENIRILHDESIFLGRLIDDLQQLSSAESGGMKLHFEMVDLPELVEQVTESFQPRGKERNITIHYRTKILPGNGLIQVSADRQRITQVLSNLLSNALKAVGNGGDIHTEVRVGPQAGYRGAGDASCVEVRISDSGPGVPMEEREKIFERFYRIDPARTRKNREVGDIRDGVGTGLGLSISREIIRAHGGSIRAADNPDGKGALFCFTLPRKME